MDSFQLHVFLQIGWSFSILSFVFDFKTCLIFRYNREEVVRSLGKEVNLNPPLTLGQLQDTPEELLKLDQVFIKSELKVGVIYIKENQYTEEEILENNENSPLFDEFLQLLGDKVRLKGFDKYKGGLDTVHDLTG